MNRLLGFAAATTVVLATCSPLVAHTQQSASGRTVSYSFQLAGCPSAITFTVPAAFERAQDKQEVADKKGCFARYHEPAGSMECLYQDWKSNAKFPRLEVASWNGFDPQIPPGQMNEKRWTEIRAGLGGIPSAARDDRIMRSIRFYEPSAPADDEALRQRYAEFFRDTPDSAQRVATVMGGEDSYIVFGRYYHTHGCIVSAIFYVAYPSELPQTTLNNWLRHVQVQ